MSTHLPLGEGAEFDVIRQLLETWGPAAVGIGDDAAIIDVPQGERLVASTDATVERVHFHREWLTAEEIGGRAAAAALSDLAAMAAQPRGLLLALGVPESWRAALPAVARGVGLVAASVGCPIVGGNITSASELTICITVLGSAHHPLTRSGVEPGDTIFVTGSLGGPGDALRAWLGGATPGAASRQRFVSPVPRVREARWLATQGARAAIDISDGLRGDAIHLARASGVSLILNGAAVPRLVGVDAEQAMASGEEYELLLAFPPDCAPNVEEFERTFQLPLTAIGVAVPAGERPVEITDLSPGDVAGFDHLR